MNGAASICAPALLPDGPLVQVTLVLSVATELYVQFTEPLGSALPFAMEAPFPLGNPLEQAMLRAPIATMPNRRVQTDFMIDEAFLGNSNSTSCCVIAYLR